MKFDALAGRRPGGVWGERLPHRLQFLGGLERLREPTASHVSVRVG